MSPKVSRVFSGIQPTGDLHVGNYFGAIENWVRLQDVHDETIYCVVDYHAITDEVDAGKLARRTLEVTGDLVACGIDPTRSVLFAQSHVPEHTELCWVLSAFASYGDLTRMTQFKDKSEHSQFVNLGLFAYPVLQAADILLYRADGVPVGEDQSQHLELTREIARRFNHVVGEEFFPEVQTLLSEAKRIMSPADPESKMSKSLGDKHYIGLMEPEESISRKIRSAVTDPGGEVSDELSPGVANLIGLLRLCDPELAEEYRQEALQGTLMYGHLKATLEEQLLELLAPIRARRRELADEDIRDLLRDGARRAREIARATMHDVHRLVGVGSAVLG